MSRFNFMFSEAELSKKHAKGSGLPQPPIGLGIDFGTSNSAAAFFDGEQVVVVPLEQNGTTMPSATYIDRSFQTTTGQEAVDKYIESNIGRKVELSAPLLGEARTTTGQFNDDGVPTEATTLKIYGQALDDANQQGRLFRGIKRLLGNQSIDRIPIYDRPFRLVALLTPILLRIRKSIENSLRNFDCESPISADYACLGHPVNFEGSNEPDNALALQRLGEAYRYAGIKNQTFCPEPIAAALSYLAETRLPTNVTLLTVDFGGGTLDCCILKKYESSFDVTAIHGIGLGGDHIDQRIYRELIFPLLGKGERWKRRTPDGEIDAIFPFSDYGDSLINWAVTYMLNQNKYTAPVISGIEQGGAAAVKFRRLLDLIYYNYSYLIFQAIKEFKAQLSVAEEAVLDIPEIDIKATLTRTEFEVMIAEELKTFEQAIQDTLKMASMRSSDIDLVMCTGGSSLIPIVKQTLNEKFPGKIVQHNPLTSVASGLAIGNYYNYGSS